MAARQVLGGDSAADVTAAPALAAFADCSHGAATRRGRFGQIRKQETRSACKAPAPSAQRGSRPRPGGGGAGVDGVKGGPGVGRPCPYDLNDRLDHCEVGRRQCRFTTTPASGTWALPTPGCAPLCHRPPTAGRSSAWRRPRTPAGATGAAGRARPLFFGRAERGRTAAWNAKQCYYDPGGTGVTWKNIVGGDLGALARHPDRALAPTSRSDVQRWDRTTGGSASRPQSDSSKSAERQRIYGASAGTATSTEVVPCRSSAASSTAQRLRLQSPGPTCWAVGNAAAGDSAAMLTAHPATPRLSPSRPTPCSAAATPPRSRFEARPPPPR